MLLFGHRPDACSIGASLLTTSGVVPYSFAKLLSRAPFFDKNKLCRRLTILVVGTDMKLLVVMKVNNQCRRHVHRELVDVADRAATRFPLTGLVVIVSTRCLFWDDK